MSQSRSGALSALLEVAAEQGGYVTTAQAEELEVSRTQLTSLQRHGDLRRVRRGVYAMRHANHRLEDELTAWLYFQRDQLPWDRADPRSVVSDASAASIHRLGTIIPGLPTVTMMPGVSGKTRRKDIRTRTAPLDPLDWVWLEIESLRVPVTTVARTIVDLIVDHEELSYVRRAIAEALKDGLATGDELVEAAIRRRVRAGRLPEAVRKLAESVG